jgi:hypothetical protein
MWSIRIYNTRDGSEEEVVFPVSGSWGRVLNGKRSGSHLFQMGDEQDDDLDWAALMTPWARQLVVQRDDGAAFGIVPTVVYAGTIKRTVVAIDDDTMAVDHEEIRCIFDKRFTYGLNGYSGNLPTDNDLPLPNLQWQSIVSALLWSGTIGPTGNYGMPFVVPPQGLVGTNSEHYYDDKLTSINKALDAIIAVGPDIDFEARLTTARTLEWLVRVGPESTKYLTGEVFDFYMMTQDPGLHAVTRTVDGALQATTSYMVGEGAGRTMLVKYKRATTTGPALDRVEVDKQLDKEADVQAHADAGLDLNVDPSIQWEAKMMAGEWPGVGALRLGSILRLHFKDKRGIPNTSTGYHVVRLIGISGDLGEEVTLDVQPFGGTY